MVSRPSQREKVARLLRAAGVEVWAEDITMTRGSVLADVLSHWSVIGKHDGHNIEIASPYTLTECAKGIRLVCDPGKLWCLYGQVGAIPVGRQIKDELTQPWTSRDKNSDNLPTVAR